MIYGIGMDLCNVGRIRSLSYKGSFIIKYFSQTERIYIEEKGSAADQTIAGMLAAKEAFVKMLGTGFENMDLAAIEILHDTNGRPYYHPVRWAEQALRERFISDVFLSISHDGNIAGAYALAEVSE